MCSVDSLKLIFIPLLLLLLASCGSPKQNYTQFPEEINTTTGLREFRLQPSDCINTPYEHIESRCSKNEEVTVTEDGQGQQHVTIHEQTPWLDRDKAKTVIEPTIQFDEIKEIVLVSAKMRTNQGGNPPQFEDTIYRFEGSLKDFRQRYAQDNSERYVHLIKKVGGTEVLNGMVYCAERPKCHEVTLLFSFSNVNEQGQRFLDSRSFQIDARESEFQPSDAIAGEAKPRHLEVSIAEINLPEIEATPQTDESNPESSALFENVLPPILPYDSSQHLCKGFENEVCPEYLFDPTQRPEQKPTTTLKDDELEELEAVDETMYETPPPPTTTAPVPTQDETPQSRPEETEDNTPQAGGQISEDTVIPRPVPRPEGLGTGTTNTNTDDTDTDDTPDETPEAQVQLPEGDNIPRPMPRPEGLGTSSASQQQNPPTGDAALQSIDGRFTYDLHACSDELNKIKSSSFHQAKGFYSDGRLERSSTYETEFSEINRPHPSRESRQYASGITHLAVDYAACVLRQRYSSDVKIDVHDFSSRNGGRLSGHGSHQNGLDVDVSYPHLGDSTSGFDDFTKDSSERRTVLALDYARILYATDRIHILFTDKAIKQRFCDYAKRSSDPSKNIAFINKNFRHIGGHKNHYHIRVKCTNQNEYCKPQGQITTIPCD